MSESSTPDRPEPAKETQVPLDTATFKRASKIFSLLSDDATTDDDW